MRFWIDRSCLKKDYFIIKDSLYHHICCVSKIQKGERFELFCEGLQKYEVFLDSLSSSQARARIVKAHPVPSLKKPYLHLAVSLPRLVKFESLLETAVQLGVKEIHPFLSEFSFFKKSSDLKAHRKQRWERIIDSSMAVAGRTQRMKIHDLVSFSEIEVSKDSEILIAYEGSKLSLKESLSKNKKPADVWLFVGSEGGFSQKELEDFRKRNPSAGLFSMGEQILRVELACLFGLSLLKYHYHF